MRARHHREDPMMNAGGDARTRQPASTAGDNGSRALISAELAGPQGSVTADSTITGNLQPSSRSGAGRRPGAGMAEGAQRGRHDQGTLHFRRGKADRVGGGGRNHEVETFG